MCWFQDVESGTPIDEEEYPIYSQLRFSNALIQKVNQLSKQVRFEVYQNTVMYFEIVVKQHREGKSFLTYFNPYIELGIEPFYWYTDHYKLLKHCIFSCHNMSWLALEKYHRLTPTYATNRQRHFKDSKMTSLQYGTDKNRGLFICNEIDPESKANVLEAKKIVHN